MNAIKKQIIFIGRARRGTLEYESDGYVPTGERQQGVLGVGVCRMKEIIRCGIQKELVLFGVNFPT